MTARRRMKLAVLALKGAVALALVALPLPAQAATGDPEIKEFTVKPGVVCPQPAPGTAPTCQAGGHQRLDIHMRFCDPFNGDHLTEGCTLEQLGSHLSDFTLRLPPGLLGNPLAAFPACPTFLFLASSCPDNTRVGHTETLAVGGGTSTVYPSELYNIQTLGFEPARLGTNFLPFTRGVLPVTISVDTADESGAPGDGDFSIDSTATDLPNSIKVVQVDTTLFGNVNGKPFIVNPTSCKDISVTLAARAHETNTVVEAQSNTLAGAFKRPSYQTTGCDSVPFTPDVIATPDNTQAGAPSGYDVAIQYPPYADADIWQSALKSATVTLPEGVALSSGGGVGLEGCTREQFGVNAAGKQINNDPSSCPDASQIGDIRVESPVLPQALTGKAFFGPTTAPGQPTPESPWKLFLLIEGQGLRIKLVGDVSVSALGQITTTFPQNPEVPFTRFELHTKGGDFAPLANPRTCGDHTGQATLTGYNGQTIALNPTVTIDQNCDRPFQPAVEDASAIPTQAGAFSTSHLLVSRPDGHQLIKTLHLALPPGAVGSLAAVPLCPASIVSALQSNPSANCPDSSKVGTIRNTVGTGNGLLTVAGSVYIGEPLQNGDAASFVIVVPAKVGPIDLGRVVVVNRALLRPTDSGVDVASPDIPTILDGVPLPVRKIDITVDREGFFLNPTGCDRRLFVATFTSDEGASARSEFPAQATGCANLRFAPKLRLIAGGPGLTKTNAHPPLKAIVTQSSGEANISKARVVLPDIIRPNVPAFQKPGALCNDAQLAARACPRLSQIGNASVITPVLPFKLSGPVYIVLRAGRPLPNLAVFLRGHGIEVVLSAGNGFSGIRILNTFDSVPDVAQSRFELDVNGGPNGILLAHSDLCKTRPVPTFDATFIGQNGKTATSKPKLETDGCESALGARVSIASRVVKVTKRHVAPIKLRCGPRSGACRGRLSLKGFGSKTFKIGAGKAKTVKVKLSRKGFRKLKHAGHMRASATTSVNGGKRATRKITLKAPGKKHRH